MRKNEEAGRHDGSVAATQAIKATHRSRMDLDTGAGVPQPSRMSRNQALHAAALALPKEERADLAIDLIDSLDGPADEGVEEAWAVEIDARVTAWRAGQAEVIPFEAAVSAARERLKARHG